MNVRKFIAANVRDALKKVKETLGDDAIILSNRGVPGGVEIMAVAARDMAMIVPTQADSRVSAPARVADPVITDDEDYRVAINAARARATIPAPGTAPAPVAARDRGGVSAAAPAVRHAPLVNAAIARTAAMKSGESQARMPVQPKMAEAAPKVAAPRASVVQPEMSPAMQAKREAEVIPLEVMEEIRSLRKVVEQHLAGIAWGETTRSQPVKADLMRQMLDAGFSPQFSRNMLEELPGDMNAMQALAWVRGAADRALATIGSEDDIVERGGVYALVGPTGVGKTTTTAKLAARCVLRHGPGKVALVTTDGYRIGAHEQLRIYGRILGVSVYLAKDEIELQQVLRELQHKHMVIVDTMGMSQKDKLVPELTGMLSGCAVQRLLLLPATSRGDTLDDVVRAYEGDHLAGCILTKIDEAASLATALDVIMRQGLRLFYVSNGQRVPEDLHLPNRSYLLHRAFREVPDSSPHKYDGLEPGLLMSGALGTTAVAGGRRG